MDTSDKFTIHVFIDNQSRSFTIRRDQEEVFRRAADLVNARLNHYRSLHPNQDVRLYMEMTLMELATSLIQTKARKDTQPYIDALTEFTRKIEQTLGIESAVPS